MQGHFLHQIQNSRSNNKARKRALTVGPSELSDCIDESFMEVGGPAESGLRIRSQHQSRVSGGTHLMNLINGSRHYIEGFMVELLLLLIMVMMGLNESGIHPPSLSLSLSLSISSSTSTSEL